MKFDDLPDAYKKRLDANRGPTCESYFDAFFEAYTNDIPDDAEIIDDELMSFARRYPGDNDPHYSISLARSTQFDDGYWARVFELTLRYELSIPNYWLPDFHSICPRRDLGTDFYREFKSTLAFRWYRRSRPTAIAAYNHTEDGMLDMLTTMAPLLCGTDHDAEP
jgi:hypothetical protein